MKVNLALYILRYMIVSASVGQGQLVKLSDFRKSIDAPPNTFHRHVNSLIENDFIVRISRDLYSLNAEFVNHVSLAKYQLPLPSFPIGDKWMAKND